MNKKQRKRRLKELNEQQKQVRDARNEAREKDQSHDHSRFFTTPYAQGGIVLPPAGGSLGMFQFVNPFADAEENIIDNVKKIGAEFTKIAAQLDLTKEQYEKFKQIMREEPDEDDTPPGLPRMK